MKRTSLILYFAALILALTLAYFSWTAAPKKPGDKVTILECGTGELQKLTLKEKDRTVTYSRRTAPSSTQAFWWVEATRAPVTPAQRDQEPAPGSDTAEGAAGASGSDSTKSPSDAGTAQGPTPAAAAAAGQGESLAVPEVFKGNKSLTDALVNFCPWQGLRSLGQLGEDKRKEFGLEDGGNYLELELSSGGTRRFLLGEASYGPKDRYLSDEESKEIFLVEGQSLKDFLYPKSRYMERSLQGFKKEELKRLRMTSGGRVKELIHVAEAGQAGEAAKLPEDAWADARNPGQGKDIYGNWLRKVFNLRPIEYMPGGEPRGQGPLGCAAPEGAEIVATLTYYDDKAEIGFLTLYRKPDQKGTFDFYACSENTASLVKISKTQTENVLKDMEDVFTES